jgi:PD-(D/E)XK nuclease superfamily
MGVQVDEATSCHALLATSLTEPPGAVWTTCAFGVQNLQTCNSPPANSYSRDPLSNVEVVGLKLSYSSISTYETCPAKFKFQYEDKVPTASSPALEMVWVSDRFAVQDFTDARSRPDGGRNAILASGEGCEPAPM